MKPLNSTHGNTKKDQKSIVEAMFNAFMPEVEFIDVTPDEKESDDKTYWDKVYLGYQGTKI